MPPEQPFGREWAPHAIVFDFDGVIAVTEDLHHATFIETLAGVELSFSREECDREFLGRSDHECFRRAFELGGRPPLSPAELTRLIDEKQRRYLDRVDSVELYPGARETVEHARRRNPIGIASGARREEIVRVLERFELLDSFRFVLCADDGLASKPDPAIYSRAYDLHARDSGARLDPGQCLAIEDTPAGIAAARSAGLRCVAVGHTVDCDRLREADWVVGGVDEVGAALAGAESPVFRGKPSATG